MKWRTEILIEPSDIQIFPQDFMISMGSCFAVHMHEKLEYFGFGTMTNPTGILYNSRSIVKMLKILLGKEKLDKKLFVERDEMICHYDFHMDMRAESEEAFMNLLGQAQKAFQESWEKTTILIFTFGTAHVYTKDDEIVANCHKQAGRLFEKRILSIEEIQDDLREIQHLAEARKTLFTVSPVRHLKDGFVENHLSKAHLLSAIHHSKLNYFPAYEIVLDDLRDYRFYEKDLVHPSSEAIEYVWEKFKTTFITSQTQEKLKKMDKLRRLQNHRPFNSSSNSSEVIANKIEQQLMSLKSEFPFLIEKLKSIAK